MIKSLHRPLALLIAVVILSSPVIAQQKRQPAPRKPAAAEIAEPVPTFDTLLSADSYKVYSELRNVGGLIHSPAIDELLEPLVTLGRPPKEFDTILKWLKARGDALVGARMMAASWPSRSSLPFVLIAIEFPSPEEAKKFFPQLRDFLPRVLPPPATGETPAPLTNPTPNLSTRTLDGSITGSEPDTSVKVIAPQPANNAVAVMPNLPYSLRQVGSLVLISPTPLDLRELKPRGSMPLQEDQNFILARNRLASEPVFVFFDLKAIEKEEKTRRQRWEEEETKRGEIRASKEAAIAEPSAEPESTATPPPVEELPPPPRTELTVTPAPGVSRVEAPIPGTLSGGPIEGTAPNFMSLYGMAFGGSQTKWPEAIGAALVIEGDAYVVRTLILNSAENKNNAVPFIPILSPGPAIIPSAASVFPANTDLFVSVSLDYGQSYEEMLKAIANVDAISRRYNRTAVRGSQPPESPFAYYEKKLGLKIKDDLLPLLGNEIALALPRRKAEVPADTNKTDLTDKTPTKPVRPPEPIPVLAISIKDREAVKRVIPKVIEAIGFKGAQLIAQTERRESTEITSYAGVFAYAFIDDFLVVSPDAAETRRVVDAYLSHQTLASDATFKNATRWQSRQVLGQVYIAPSVVEQYTSGAVRGGSTDNLAELMTRIGPVIDPMTYSLSNDGSGPLHELHVPKNLLQLIFAGVSNQQKPSPLHDNEVTARMVLYSIAYGQENFKTSGGNYGTLDELVSKSFVHKEMMENHGYNFLVSVSGNAFEAVAVPIEYGKSGRLSFFIDNSGILRGGDHGGGAATASDDPFQDR